jgi:hypothetical protein
MTSYAEFWKWFRDHEGELLDFESARERVFDELAVQLRNVDPDLTFEFGPKRKRREFIVSAGGIKNAFPMVSALVAAAPNLECWRVIAFRPRRDPLNVVEFRGKSVDPKDVQFSLLDDGKRAGIYLFIPGFTKDDSDLKQIGYLLLDDALGEYDVECRVALIEMFSPETPTDGDRYQLSELPRLFDTLASQLEDRS